MKPPGRRIAIVVGISAGILLVVLIFNYRRDLSVKYKFWRLDCVDTWEKAAPLLDALASGARCDADSNLLVGRLGPSHQRYTFWFFAALQHEPSRIALRPENEEPFRALQARLKDDSELISMWIQFLRWRHDYCFRDRTKEPIEAALARVEFAQICVIPDVDEKRFAQTRWVGENLLGADIKEINRPTLPFPGWSGPVFTLPSSQAIYK